MSTFTTAAFDKAATAWTEAQSGSLWVPDKADMAETAVDAPAYQPLTFNQPQLNVALDEVTGAMDADLALLDAKLQEIYSKMFAALQPTQAVQQALLAADQQIAAADIGTSERLRDEYLAHSYDPLIGLKQLGLNPVAPRRDSTLRDDTLNAFAAAREKARKQRALMLRTKKIALAVEIVNLTRELVGAEVEARLKLLTTASLPLQEQKLKTEFATEVVDNQVKQLRYQSWKLEEGSAKKTEALYKAQAKYERIALKSGLSMDAVQSVIASAAQAAAGALNSVSFGYSDSSFDKISYDYNNPP